MQISDRIVRREIEDRVEIGIRLEDFYNSDAGTVIRAMINARISEQFSNPEDAKTSADRKLGRAEGLQMLINDIELAIQDMKQLTAPIEEQK